MTGTPLTSAPLDGDVTTRPGRLLGDQPLLAEGQVVARTRPGPGPASTAGPPGRSCCAACRSAGRPRPCRGSWRSPDGSTPGCGRCGPRRRRWARRRPSRSLGALPGERHQVADGRAVGRAHQRDRSATACGRRGRRGTRSSRTDRRSSFDAARTGEPVVRLAGLVVGQGLHRAQRVLRGAPDPADVGEVGVEGHVDPVEGGTVDRLPLHQRGRPLGLALDRPRAQCAGCRGHGRVEGLDRDGPAGRRRRSPRSPEVKATICHSYSPGVGHLGGGEAAAPGVAQRPGALVVRRSAPRRRSSPAGNRRTS